MTRFKWGILGPGLIAQKFATGVKALKDAQIYAVASRSPERANAFADQYGAPKRYGSYTELANDPDVDAIYIATPNTLHLEHTTLCLKAGKPVLCEKPFTMNAGEAEKSIACARTENVFLMEAMWTRCLPIYDTVRKWIDNGEIGDVQIVKGDFGFREVWPDEDRHANMSIGGGALIDIGVYPIALAYMVFGGPPTKAKAVAYFYGTGADRQTAILLGYEKGQMALMACTFDTPMYDEAWIYGTKGQIRIPFFWRATSATLMRDGREVDSTSAPFLANGYEYEAIEAMKCIREGKKESPRIRLEETLQIVRTMDQLRAEIGLRYPCEN